MDSITKGSEKQSPIVQRDILIIPKYIISVNFNTYAKRKCKQLIFRYEQLIWLLHDKKMYTHIYIKPKKWSQFGYDWADLAEYRTWPRFYAFKYLQQIW